MLEAATLLKGGQLVGMPTETVYGLAADATNDAAVAQVFALKGRPQFNPLIVHFADIAALKKHVEWNDKANKLAHAFCPGPLTMVLPRLPSSSISLLASAGLDTLAVRIPKHPVARALIEGAGVPLAAPSANKSGHISPTNAAHVKSEFPDRLLVLDGGACEVGLESTVVEVGERVTILRLGSITQAMLEAALGEAVGTLTHTDTIRSPGQLLKHYAPRARLRLNAQHVDKNEALLAFGTPLTGAETTLNLSPNLDLTEAASNLFNMLRELDATGVEAIAVMPIPEAGIGAAINDRLRRGAC